MTATRLLAEIELGRRPETEREPLLEELMAGSAYERRLVLTSTFDSREAGRAVQAALDISGSVHGPAISQVARLCSDEQFTRLLQELPAVRHRRLLAHWRRAGRHADESRQFHHGGTEPHGYCGGAKDGAAAPGSRSPERMARLREYRADSSVLVAAAAQFTLPDAELQVAEEH